MAIELVKALFPLQHRGAEGRERVQGGGRIWSEHAEIRSTGGRLAGFEVCRRKRRKSKRKKSKTSRPTGINTASHRRSAMADKTTQDWGEVLADWRAVLKL